MTSPEQFLEYEVLRHGETRTGRESKLLAIGERLGNLELHRIFTPYKTSAPQTPHRKDDHEKFRAMTLELRNLIKGAAHTSQEHHAKDYSGDTAKTTPDVINEGRYVSDRKLGEIIALGIQSGALNNTAPAYIDDMCGGSGILSHAIAALRGDPFTTITNVFEREERHAEKFHAFARAFGRESASNFFLTDIKDYRVRQRHDRQTFILAKHACGNASDYALAALKIAPNHSFSRAAILTCCHGEGPTPPKKPATSSISDDDWRMLLKTADWTSDANHVEHQVAGKVAMRIIDCLRATHMLPSLRARVEEILPTDIAPKNHAIIIEPA